MFISTIISYPLLSLCIALLCRFIFKLNIKSFFYLLLLPGIFFSFLPVKVLLLATTLGMTIYFCLRSNRYIIQIIPLFFLLVLSVYYHPQLHFSPSQTLSVTNFINSQRGEHTDVQPSFIGKVLHNKTSFLFPFVGNLEKYFSPVSLFTRYPRPLLFEVYPLGFFFPWDILLFLSLLFHSQKLSRPKPTAILFFTVTTVLLGFGQSVLLQSLLSTSILFSLALAFAQKLKSINNNKFIVLLTLNTIYLTGHLFVLLTSSFSQL